MDCEDVWRPIESAPTDGTPVLVYVPGWERSNVLIGWWDDHPRCRCWIAGGYMHKHRPPTMWRPAPEPPTEHGMPC